MKKFSLSIVILLTFLTNSSLLAQSEDLTQTYRSCQAHFKNPKSSLEQILHLAENTASESAPNLYSSDSSGIPDHLLDSNYRFWRSLFRATRRTRLRTTIEALANRRIPKFKVLGYDELPRVQEDEPTSIETNREFWDGLDGLKYSSRASEWFDQMNEASVRHIGKVSLTPILVAEEKRDIERDRELLGTTSFIGYLENDLPVQVVLLGQDRHNRSDVPLVEGDARTLIIGNAAIASHLNGNQKFYGIQKFGNNVFGVVLSLSKPGLPMQFGGMKYFNENTLPSALKTFQYLSSIISDVRIRDLRPFVKKDGLLSFYPTTLGEDLRDSKSSFFTPGLWEERLSEMGVDGNGREYINILGSEGVPYSMAEFLKRFSGNKIPPDVRNAIRAYLESLLDEETWVNQNIVKTLVREAISLRAWEIHVNSNGRTEMPNLEYVYVTELFSIFEERGLNVENFLRGPLIPGASPRSSQEATSENWRVRNYRYLEPGMNVVFRVSKANEDNWNHPDLEPDQLRAGELLKIEVDENYEVHYVFKIRWRDDITPGIVNERLRLSEGQLNRLGIYSYSLGLPSIMARRRDQIRQERATYKPLISLNVPEEGRIRSSIQRIVEDAKEHSTVSLRPQQYSDRNGPNGPTPGKYQLDSHQEAIARGVTQLSNGTPVLYAHYNLNKTHLFLTGENGAVEVWDYVNLNKLYSLKKNEVKGYDGFRCITVIGKEYFVTYEPSSGSSRDRATIRRISDGKIIGEGSPDGYVTTLLAPDESYAHIIGLGYPISLYLPSGKVRGDSFDGSKNDPYLQTFWDSTLGMPMLIPGHTTSDYFNNGIITPDGKYIILVMNGWGNNDHIGVIRTRDNALMGTINSGVIDITDIHVTSDSKHLVVDRKGIENPEVFKIEEIGAPEVSEIRPTEN